MSSLSTLLAAAQFLEQQEMEQKQAATNESVQNQNPTTVPLASASPVQVQPVIQKPVTNIKQLNSQTVVITTSNLNPSLVKGAVALATPLTIKKDEEIPSITQAYPPRRVLHNSFDIMNPLLIDDSSEGKRKQPPLVFRAGTREVHNKLEKHRRAHLKECFDFLKKQLPPSPDEKKTSNLSILHSALRYIQTLRRKERELEHEMERLAREKISSQNKLAVLKKEISLHCDIDFSKILPEVLPNTQSIPSSSSTSTVEISIVESDREPKITTVTTPDMSTAKVEVITTNSNISERISLPVLANKSQIPVTSSQITPIKEVQQPVQTALSVLPVGYPMSQGLVLQKLAIVPKGLTDLTPLVSTHFITTTPQQLNGKVVPLVNAQYVVKPMVVVSTASPRPT